MQQKRQKQRLLEARNNAICMKVEATLRNLRIAPRKVRTLSRMLSGMPVDTALHQLGFELRRGALPLEKLIRSAVANAEHNFNMMRDNLLVRQVLVDEGRTLKRWMPRAQGRATPIWKRSSHVHVVLEEMVEGRRVERSTSEGKDTKKLHRSVRTKSTGSASSESSVNVAAKKTTPAPSARRVFQRKAS